MHKYNSNPAAYLNHKESSRLNRRLQWAIICMVSIPILMALATAFFQTIRLAWWR